MPTAKPQQSTHLHPGNLAWMPSFGAFAQLRTRVPTRSPPGGLPSGTRIAAPIVWTVAMTPLLADRRMNSEGDPHSSQTRRCRSSRSGQSSPPLFLPRQFIGVFSRSLRPVLSVQSDDFVSIVTLTHHACDDYAHMIAGAPGAESVFLWTEMVKNVRGRGAGPIDASIRTGPVFSARSRARRRARVPHPRGEAARLPQSNLRRPCFSAATSPRGRGASKTTICKDRVSSIARFSIPCRVGTCPTS